MKTRNLSLVLIAMALLCLGRESAAQTSVCSNLEGAQRETALSVLKSQHAYDCCDRTLHECLKAKKVCRLVKRLAADVCVRAGRGESQKQIVRALARRSLSATGPKSQIDLSKAPVAGDANAKVSIVLFVCPRCPFCAKFTPALYRNVTGGALQGKAKLYVRPFPIRSHKHSTISSMAWMAAHRLGHFWDMVLQMYAHFDKFNPDRLGDCARGAGMDPKPFKKLLGDSSLRKQLVASKKEGLRNHVDATPTVFVNGRKYYGDLTPEALEDFSLEQHDKVTGKRY